MSLSILLDSFSSWSNNSARYSRCRNIRSSCHNNVRFFFFFFIGFTQKECRVTVKTYRDRLREAKAHLSWIWWEMWRATGKFYRNISSKRKIRPNLGPLMSWVRELVTKSVEKTKVYCFFNSVFNGEICIQESWAHSDQWEVWSEDNLPLVEEGRG